MKEHGKAATESQADEHEAVDLGLFSCCVQVFPGQDLKDVPEEEGEGGGDCGHADGGDRSHGDERPLLGVDLEQAPQAKKTKKTKKRQKRQKKRQKTT